MHPTAGRHLERELDVLPLAERVEGRRDRTELSAERREEHQVIDDPVHLEHRHAQVLSARWHLYLHQGLESDGQRDLVVDPGQPVHARNEVGYLTVVPRLDELFVTPMHVTDDRIGVDEHFTVDRREQPEHSVCRGMLRADVEDHLLGHQLPGGHLRGDLRRVFDAVDVGVGEPPVLGYGHLAPATSRGLFGILGSGPGFDEAAR